MFCGGPLGITLTQSFYSVAFAKEISQGLSVGVAPLIAYQQLGRRWKAFATLLAVSPPILRTSRTAARTAPGAGVRGGLEWKIAPGLRVGVAGHPRIFMSKFDKYRGLLAEQGDFDIPGDDPGRRRLSTCGRTSP